MRKKIIITIIGILTVGVLVIALLINFNIIDTSGFQKKFFEPNTADLPKGMSVSELENTQVSDSTKDFASNFELEESLDLNQLEELPLETIAQNLEIPWEIEFLPQNQILLTERVGKLKQLGQDELEIELEEINAKGEGGLLGLTLHPNFNENNFIYLYFSSNQNGKNINKVIRYKFLEGELLEPKIIITNIPGAVYHDGGKIAFGPDGYLYITTGDATEPDLAQDLNSLAGKILRLTDEGAIPEDNPYSSEVYSYGHRNPQGLTWDEQGQLWSTEHGRSGLRSGMDEVNLIEKGGNYGWPIIEGDEEAPGLITPKLHSGPDKTWAPAAIEYYDSKLYFTGLRGEALYEVEISSNNSLENFTSHFFQDFGRLRALKVGPDGYLYISTSNRDGRGNVRENDDKIIKVSLKSLNQ